MPNDSVRRITHMEPLPAPPKPEGRWGEPFVRLVNGEEHWVMYLRIPLTGRPLAAGMKGVVFGRSKENVIHAAQIEDQRYEEWQASQAAAAAQTDTPSQGVES